MLPDGLELDGPLDEDHASDPANRARLSKTAKSGDGQASARGNVQA
jgi:hypothetical protein